jgi:(aminoalkyl)phosphonate N-acetyltransferase
MATLIRPALPADLPAVYDFICQLEEQIFDNEVFERIYLQNIQHPDRHYLVACNAQNKPIGYASMHAQDLLHHCGKVAEIQEMFVIAECRNEGIGKLLVEALVAIAQDKGYVLVEVTSNKKRDDTHRFYLKNNFLDTHIKFVKPLQ